MAIKDLEKYERPLSKLKSNIQDMTSKYEQIASKIYSELMVSELSENIGLLYGTSGVALFLVYYDRLINNKKLSIKELLIYLNILLNKLILEICIILFAME